MLCWPTPRRGRRRSRPDPIRDRSRLDRDTSGVLLVAATRAALQALQAQFKRGRWTKLYQALAYGHLTPAEAMIEAPLARDPQQRQRIAVARRGRAHALTRYRVTEYLQGACLAEICPAHRAHASDPRAPGLHRPPHRGDGYTATAQAIAAPRQMLHAWQLSFDHPTRRTADLPREIPEEHGRLIATLRGRA